MPSQPVQRFFDQAAETAPWEQRREILGRRLARAVDDALTRSPAYAEFYAAAGIGPGHVKGLDDLAGLPILRMADIYNRQASHPPFGGFETVPTDRMSRIYINPGRIIQPGEWDYCDSSWAQALAGAGIGPGDICLNTFNYHMWPYAFMLDASAKMVGATVVPTGVGNTLMQVQVLKDLGVTAFMGTPSFLMTITQRAEGLGLDVKRDLSLSRALVGAEMLPESLRTRLEDKLGIPIRQAYGTVLLGCLGYECSVKEGLHLSTEVIVEVVDPGSGAPLPPGKAGEIVATCFNPVFPMIRLATGDLSLMMEDSCACGRSGPRLKKVLGRVDQATKVRGTFIHPWQADEVMASHPEVFKYQVVISREGVSDVMTFMVEPADDSLDAGRLAARLERDIKEMLTISGRVQVVPRGSIPAFHKKIEDHRSWE